MVELDLNPILKSQIFQPNKLIKYIARTWFNGFKGATKKVLEIAAEKEWLTTEAK